MNRSNDVSYDSFVAELQQSGFKVDLTTLEKSWRCSAEVCDYIRKKLRVNIMSIGDHSGSVLWFDDPISVLDDAQITKLVFQEAANYTFPALKLVIFQGRYS